MEALQKVSEGVYRLTHGDLTANLTENIQNCTKFIVDSAEFSDQGLKELSELKVSILTVNKGNFTNTGLSQYLAEGQLRALTLKNCQQITGAAFQKTPLRSFAYANLENIKCSHKEFIALCENYLSNTVGIRLHQFTGITDNELASGFVKLTSLSDLTLSKTSIGNNAIASLRQIEGLEDIFIAGSTIDKEMAREFAAFEGLETLVFTNCAFPRHALQSFAQSSSSLGQVTFNNCQGVTHKTAELLAKNKQGLHVIFAENGWVQSWGFHPEDPSQEVLWNNIPIDMN